MHRDELGPGQGSGQGCTRVRVGAHEMPCRWYSGSLMGVGGGVQALQKTGRHLRRYGWGGQGMWYCVCVCVHSGKDTVGSLSVPTCLGMRSYLLGRVREKLGVFV